MTHQPPVPTHRENLLTRIKVCCDNLDDQRLRRVAKLAYEEVQHQKRARTMQAQAQAQAQANDIPTAADPDNPEEEGAKPLARVWVVESQPTPA